MKSTGDGDESAQREPTHTAVDVSGTLTHHEPGAFFSFNLRPGDAPHLVVSAKDPTKLPGVVVQAAAGRGSPSRPSKGWFACH